MAAIFCIATMGGLSGYKIWQPHLNLYPPSYTVSPQLGDVMGVGVISIISKHSWRGLSCHCLGSLSDQLLI